MAIPKSDCAKVEMATKKELAAALHAGEYMMQFDFMAYYDQFMLSDLVSHRLCFRSEGKYFRIKTLPMGLRVAVGVAGTVTERLLDFEKRSTALSIIDNVLFIGTREDVLRDARIFVERVKMVGAQLNENTDNLESLLAQRGTWAGVAIDLVAKTTQLSPKSVSKTLYSWSRRATWTWRKFACHVGLLWWACGILEVPVADFYPLLRFISEVSTKMTDDDARWDQPAEVWPSVWRDIERWTAILVRNAPRVVPRRAAGPEWIMATDASALGWGYVAYNVSSGDIRSFCGAWYKDFVQRHGDKLGRSTFTEPHGIIFALVHLFRQVPSPAAEAKSIRLLTDNTVAEASFNRGFNSHSFDINECLRELRRRFPHHDIDFRYVPGVQNPADWFSRNPGRVASEAEREMAAASLQRVAGLVSL